MLRDMMSQLNRGDVLLTDRYLCSYVEIALFQQQGVDFVGRMQRGAWSIFAVANSLADTTMSSRGTTPATGVDVGRAIRLAPRDGFDPRVSLPHRPSGLSSANDHRGHNAAERRAIQGGGDCRPLSSSMGCRNQSSFAENDDAHGRASLSDARNGSQGDLGAFVGVQPDPNGDRSGGVQARQTSTSDRFHASHAPWRLSARCWPMRRVDNCPRSTNTCCKLSRTMKSPIVPTVLNLDNVSEDQNPIRP